MGCLCCTPCAAPAVRRKWGLAHLWRDLVQTANADDEHDLSLSRHMEALLGLGRTLQPNQVLLLQPSTPMPWMSYCMSTDQSTCCCSGWNALIAAPGPGASPAIFLTCCTYSFTYFSARLKISLRVARAFLRASRAAAAFSACHCESRFCFFASSSGTTVLDIVPKHKGKDRTRRLQGLWPRWKPTSPTNFLCAAISLLGLLCCLCGN